MCRTMPAKRACLMTAAVCSLLSSVSAAAQSVWNIDPTGTGYVELTGDDPAQSYDQVHIGRQFGEGVLVVRDGGQLFATDYIQLGNTGSPGAGLDGPGYAKLLIEQTGEAAISPAKLIPPMVEQFITSDRGFAKARKAPPSGNKIGRLP